MLNQSLVGGYYYIVLRSTSIRLSDPRWVPSSNVVNPVQHSVSLRLAATYIGKGTEAYTLLDEPPSTSTFSDLAFSLSCRDGALFRS